MSSFTAPTFHPETGEVEQAHWLDDYFGHYLYGVSFPDGKVFKDHECERVFPKALALINELKEYKYKYEGLCK